MAGEPLALGWKRGARGLQRLTVPVERFTRSHSLTTGRTGTGKTAALQGLLLELLVHHPGSRLVWMDCKGHAVDDLLDRWLPVLSRRYPHVRPQDVTVIAPFGRYAVPMNLLAPIVGLEEDVHATVVVSLFETLLGESMGARMAPILHALTRAVMLLGGSLLDVLRMLDDEGFLATVTQAIHDPELRHYLAEVLPQEPPASVRALRARLSHLLSLTRLRSMLGARDCLAGPALLDAPLTILTLGDPPFGLPELSSWLGRWWMYLLTAAIFARHEPEHDVVVFIDEFDVVAPAASELERILQKARSFRVSLHLATQSLGQIRDQGLVNTVLTNVGSWMAFDPRSEELRLLADVLPIARGTTIDPEVPDRLLSPAEEERRLHARLRGLRPRQAVWADLVERQTRLIEATMNLPFDEVRRQAEALPPELRDAFWRGRHGAAPQELTQAELRLAPVREVGAAQGEVAAVRSRRGASAPARPARRARPALELPP